MMRCDEFVKKPMNILKSSYSERAEQHARGREREKLREGGYED